MSDRTDLSTPPSRSEAASIARSLAFANDTRHRRHSPVLRHVVPGQPLQIPPSVLRRSEIQAARSTVRRPSLGAAAGRLATAVPMARTRSAATARTATRVTGRSTAAVATARASAPAASAAPAAASRRSPAISRPAADARPAAPASDRSARPTGPMRLVTAGAAALVPAPEPVQESKPFEFRVELPRRERKERPERNLRVVPEPGVHRNRTRGTVLLVLAVAIVAFLAVSMHASLAESQLRLDRVNGSISVAERRNQVLRLEVAELESPERVVREAMRLGLRSAEQVTFLAAAPAVPSRETEQIVRSTAASTPPTTPARSVPVTVPSRSSATAQTVATSVAPPSDGSVVASMALPQSTVPLVGGRIPRGQSK